MHVRTLHDKWIRITVASETEQHLVSIQKAHVTAMAKGVQDTWSASDASVNLSTHPDVDVVLQSSSPHNHSVTLSHVLDSRTVEALQTATVNHRHIMLQSLADSHDVVGVQAIAKHLVCKAAFIPSVRYNLQTVPSYHSLAQCEERLDAILMRKENSRRLAEVRGCIVTTMGSSAFRLFQHYNTTCTSKITSAFPTQTLAFAQSLCLAVGVMANASNEYAPRVVLANSLQGLEIDTDTAVHLLACGARAAASPTKTSRLSVRQEDGTTHHTHFVTVDDATRSKLALNNIQTRNDTPMYIAFDRQQNAILVADVCMRNKHVDTAQQRAQDTDQDVVTDMHFIGVAAAYHPVLEHRRQMMINKCCSLLVRPTPFTKSVFNMLRFELGPMLPLLAQIDLA